MIKVRDKDDFEVFISVPGTQTTGKKYVFVMPFAGWLKAVYSKLGTAGVTGSQTVDINDEGVTLFSSSRIVFSGSVVDPSVYGTLTTDPHFFSKGDFIDVSLDDVHSGTAAKDLSVVLVFSRKKPAGTIRGALEVSVGKGL
ncbi:hypothetical protein LCGC14_1880140 [marine sediment metagenome]|uniref:Uncharacterized protein n=1 Tax=marine sediment metagenome TaxID=412755 RepID=A0A0F9J0X8_9ZZZZ